MSRKYFQIKAFTIIELIAVVSIIGILVGLGIGLRHIGAINSNEAVTNASIFKIETILGNFKKERGYFPQSLKQSKLSTRMSDDDNFDLLKDLRGKNTNKYISNLTELINNHILVESASSSKEAYIFRDGFGNNFMYRCPGAFNVTSYDLWSVGADRVSDVDFNNKNDLNGNKEELEEESKLVNLDNITNWQ